MKKEVKIRKGNVILRVSEEEVDRYIQNGYGIVGADGKVIDPKASEESKLLEKLLESQKTIKNLKAELDKFKHDAREGSSGADEELEQKIEVLKEQNADLKEELKEAKKQLKILEKRLHKFED